MNEQPTSSDILLGLQNAIGIECPSCNEINPSNAEECEFCGEPLPVSEDDEQALSYVDAGGMAGGYVDEGPRKVPLEDSKNLILIREAFESLESGEISPEDYRMKVSKVLQVAQTGAELFRTDLFKNKIASLPQEQQNLANKTGALFEQYEAGCQLMLQYKWDGDLTPAAQGFEMVKKALTDMDRIQDRALEISDEIEEKKREEQEMEQGQEQEA